MKTEIRSTEEKLESHLDFWNGKEQKRPLLVYRLGDVFFSREFRANEKLLEKGRLLDPETIDVDAYLPDYEKMYQDLCKVDSDAFFCADPCTGFPWMEGIFGAPVKGMEWSFLTSHPYEEIEDIRDLTYSRENPWYRKYLEFSEKLVHLSDGRFPVAMPIMRGVTDTIGSLIGQESLVIAFYEDPDLLKEVFNRVVECQRELIADQNKIVPEFHGGRSFGFYHVWAPGNVMWYQEDLSALLSPAFFREFLVPTSEKYIEGYEYTAMHLHPASFAHMDEILSIKGLKTVQINRDARGLSVRDMLPQCLKVLESGKTLFLGMGAFTQDDIDTVLRCLPRERVALNLMPGGIDDANELSDYINTHV